MTDIKDIRLFCFDTEATSVSDDNGTYAVLYNWDLLRLDGDPSEVTKENVGELTIRHEGRDCTSLYDDLDWLLWDASQEPYIAKIAVHNLTYDYMYLRHWLVDKETEICCRNSTTILNIRVGNIVFFDTLAIFGYSLRTLGDNLGYAKGDIDYSQSIAPDTVLGDNNVYYNHRDTDVLMVGVCTSLLRRESVTLDNLGTRILTKTGIVRTQDRLSPAMGAYPVRGKRRNRTLYDDDRFAVQRHLIQTESEYMRWESYSKTRTTEVKGCFAGGVNLSNPRYIGRIVHDVISYDLKSAYPAIMVGYSVPTDPVDVTDTALYKRLLRRQIPDPVDVLNLRTGFWLGTVRFHGFRVDGEWTAHVQDVSITESMVLQHMASSKGVRYVDGCLSSADELVLTINTVTFYEICIQCTWVDAEFERLTVYMSRDDPTRYMTLRTLHHYREKSACKDISRGRGDVERAFSAGYISTDEYARLKTGDVDSGWMEDFVLRHKANLNALYGIMVTSPVHDEYSLDDCGLVEGLMVPYTKDMRRDAMMWREAGVMVAEMNRYKIIYMCALLVSNGIDVLYADTDSIKFTGLDKATADEIFAPVHGRIESLNETKIDRLYKSLDKSSHGLEHVELDTTITDDIRALGKLDYEGTYRDFVTFGHKKYAHGDGKVWRYRCSGYKTSVLNSFSDQLVQSGLYEVAPLIVLGYDTRYDSSTGIASIKIGIPDTWVQADFTALDHTDGDKMHRYRGWTCPGDAIFPAGKVMNNTAHSRLNLQRKQRAIHNIGTDAFFDIDVSLQDGRYVYGDRGTVYMQYKDWSGGNDA